MAVNSFNGQIIVLSAAQALPSQAELASMSPDGAPALLTYHGDVRVVAAPRPALAHSLAGLPLPDGYRVVTQPNASATLTLPDGSQIHIREMSIVELNGFVWNTQASKRGMLMSLYAGSVRVMMAAVEHEQGSFFEIKTPNALVSLHFSQPDVEVIYAPSPLENMTALLEKDMTLDQEEAALWQKVLDDRKREAARWQGTLATAAIQRDESSPPPTGMMQPVVAQQAFSQIGLIQSEGDALLQARLLQRDEGLTDSLAFAAQGADASASTAGAALPNNGMIPLLLNAEQWQNDGLIVGEDESGKGATFVFAYTTSAIFMNRLTRETRTVQPGQRALVRGLGITMTVLNGNPMEKDPPRNMGTIFALDRQGAMNREESTIQSQEDLPSLGGPGSPGRDGWGNRPRPHRVEITIEE